MNARFAMPFSCGELVQGPTPGGPECHISWPINIYASAVAEWPGPADLVPIPGQSKSGLAVERTLALLGIAGTAVSVRVFSPLPPGRGLASSTADIAAVCHATARAVGRGLSHREVADIALSIEPTDGTVLPHIVLFDHRAGAVCETLGPAPVVSVTVLDPGGEVDTKVFGARRKRYSHEALAAIGRAFDLARRGLRSGDLEMLGRAATLSAVAGQEVLHKPLLAQAIRLAESLGAFGVNVAHSGTVMGVLHNLDGRAVEAEARSRLCLEQVFTAKVVSGGAVRVFSEPAGGGQADDTDKCRGLGARLNSRDFVSV